MANPRPLPGLVRRLLDGVNLPLAIIHRKRMTVSYINPAWEELYGKGHEQIHNRPVGDLFSKETRARVIALCEMVARSPRYKMEEHDCELLRRKGRRMPVNARASVVTLSSRRWLVLSVHDLSYVRRLQTQRELNLKEMAQISKLADIGLLAAGVAHELNNPLMIVQGFAENLEMLLDQPELHREELKSQTAEILQATDRMGRIISQMSRMVRSSDIKFELVSLEEISQNVLRFLGHEIKFSNVHVVTDFQTENLIKCDHNQVEQVILNIVNNAIHALEGRAGEREIRLRCHTEKTWVQLEIWNNGPPIPKEIQDKIMTPFFTTKEVGKGTGLGLAVSFGIMKAHGGAFSFESSEEQGTQFCLRFPAPEVQPVQLQPPTHRSILLVDDDPAALTTLANKVSQFGYQVIKVRSGQEAFQIISSQPHIVAVFTDLRMPDMDGLTLCRHIRQILNPGPAVFLVTGYAPTTNLDDSLKAAGITGLLHKPINHNAFSAIMHQIGSLKRTGSD